MYDVVIIGGGHAGIEASNASARLQKKTLLITHSIDTIGQLSCNPAIGGAGKSQLVREIDVFGGVISQAADLSGLHLSLLHTSKGYSNLSVRLQVDRNLYKINVQKILAQQENLSIQEGNVISIELSNETIHLQAKDSIGNVFHIFSKTIVLTNGTFLQGHLYSGINNAPGGRNGSKEKDYLSSTLKEIIGEPIKFRTGTPPRILSSSINYNKLIKIPSTKNSYKSFSLFTEKKYLAHIDTFLAHTNNKTHEILNKYFQDIDHYSYKSPRYCTTINSKVKRFPEKLSHQIFVENEGINPIESYISNTILGNRDYQEKVVRSIEGLENAVITRSGYTVEYIIFNPMNLNLNYSLPNLPNIFLAGQINGTTGYEEAAAQGLLAGINAALAVDKKEPFILSRYESYLGVLTDDLVKKGVDEPYRMLPTRAENRMILREDNADIRLGKYAINLGILTTKQIELIEKKSLISGREINRLKNTIYSEDNYSLLGPVKNELKNKSLFSLISRYQISFSNEIFQLEDAGFLKDDLINYLRIMVEYDPYLERFHYLNKRDFNKIKIPHNIIYDLIPGLSKLGLNKLKFFLPKTLEEARHLTKASDVERIQIFLERKIS
jgi:tRNA uridine 5-carboxymethylaminomethyl modification enzyme